MNADKEFGFGFLHLSPHLRLSAVETSLSSFTLVLRESARVSAINRETIWPMEDFGFENGARLCAHKRNVQPRITHGVLGRLRFRKRLRLRLRNRKRERVLVGTAQASCV